MGVQLVGEKKVREAARMTGLPIFRVLRHSNRLWYGFVSEGEGHWHVRIDPVTWAWTLGDGAFSSCSEGTWGPHVDPPEALGHTSWLQAELDHAQKVIAWMKEAIQFYAHPGSYVEWEGSSPIDDDGGSVARAVLDGLEEDKENDG